MDEDKVDEAAMDKVDPAPTAASRATDSTQDVDAGDNAEQAYMATLVGADAMDHAR